MITYLQAVGVIEDFANQNEMVQKFGFEFKEQMPNIATEDERYPLLFVVPIGAMPTTNTNEFEIDIYCLDRYTQDRINVGSVVSDTQLILAMLTKWLEEGQTDMDVIHSYPMQPINNDLLDYCGGWSMRVRVEVDMVSICEIPLSGSTPTPPNPCDDATYTITDSALTTLYSGSIVSGGDLDQPISDSIAVLKDTLGTVISTTNILAEGSEDIVAPDAVVNYKDENGIILDTILYLSGSNQDYELLNSRANNSNESFIGVAPYGDVVALPDITVTDSDGSTYTQPSVTDVVCTLAADTTLEVNGTTEGTFASGSTIDVQLNVTPDSVTVVGNTVNIDVPTATPAPVGATLMKTGQTTSYRTGDDGDLEAGRATDFFTLASNNPFGNTNRFTDELGGSTYTNNIVIDWSTYNGVNVLGYYKGSSTTNRQWNDAIDWGLSLSVGTFTSNWRLLNRNELFNIVNDGVTTYTDYAPFNLAVDNYWSSTTMANSTTLKAYFVGSQGTIARSAITGSFKTIATRTFTVTGTTLT